MSRCLSLFLVLGRNFLLQLLFVSGLQRLPLEPARAAAPNVWQENDDSFNTGGHHAPLVHLLGAVVADLCEPVPVQRGMKSQCVNSHSTINPTCLTVFCLSRISLPTFLGTTILYHQHTFLRCCHIILVFLTSLN